MEGLEECRLRTGKHISGERQPWQATKQHQGGARLQVIYDASEGRGQPLLLHKELVQERCTTIWTKAVFHMRNGITATGDEDFTTWNEDFFFSIREIPRADSGQC